MTAKTELLIWIFQGSWFEVRRYCWHCYLYNSSFDRWILHLLNNCFLLLETWVFLFQLPVSIFESSWYCTVPKWQKLQTFRRKFLTLLQRSEWWGNVFPLNVTEYYYHSDAVRCTEDSATNHHTAQRSTVCSTEHESQLPHPFKQTKQNLLYYIHVSGAYILDFRCR